MNKLIDKLQPNKFYIIEQGGYLCDPYQKWILFITEINYNLSDDDTIYYSGLIILLDTSADIEDIDQIYLEMSVDQTTSNIPNIDLDDYYKIKEINKDEFMKYFNLFKNKKQFDNVKYTEVDLEYYQATCYFMNELQSPNYYAVIKDQLLAINVDSEFLNPNIQDWKEEADFTESEEAYFNVDWNDTISSIEEMIS